jgi:two-component system sensor histidine kinase KdpD
VAFVGLFTFILKKVESDLQIQLIALLYLLPVLGSTMAWGLTFGIIAGFLSFLAFNYYFIRPYFTLSVHQTQDLITLIVFLIVSIVVSQLVGQARVAERLAKKREWETLRLYELNSAMAGLTEVDAILQTVAQKLIETFRFRQVVISTTSGLGGEAVTSRLPADGDLKEPCDLSLLMFTARNTEGEMRLWFDQGDLSLEETRLLAAFSNQAALAVERARLFKQEQLARVLEESDRVKTSLLSSVSHELRTPLAVIKASSSSLRSGMVDWDSAARNELVETIDEEADALNLLVGNLLDMSRIEAGALHPMKRWNSIIEIVKGVAEKMHAQLRGTPVFYYYPIEFPVVPTDYILLEQVFANLLSNSIKYAPERAPIRISARVEDEQAVITVINQSPYIPEEHLEHIFDKFFRITQADTITGTGLGLSICKGLIEAHDGRIWAENQPDGFAFNIALPLMLEGEHPKLPGDDIDG